METPAIRRQCEFYFSDANILKDQFMLNQVKSSTDGWVTLELVEKFKKMQSLTRDHSTVVRALSDSTALELSEDDLPDGTQLTNAGVNELFTRPSSMVMKWGNKVITVAQGMVTNVKTILSTEFSTPLLVRIFIPNKKVPSDLKRSQTLHPQIGTKLCAVVELAEQFAASKAIGVALKKWPDAYVHFLSHGSKKLNDGTTKKRDKKKVAKDAKQSPTSTATFRPLNLKATDEANRVLHCREPIKPPTEDTVGFDLGWREMIRLERLAPPTQPSQIVPPAMTTITTAPVTVTSPVPALIIPDDSAIVCIIPHSQPSGPVITMGSGV